MRKPINTGHPLGQKLKRCHPNCLACHNPNSTIKHCKCLLTFRVLSLTGELFLKAFGFVYPKKVMFV